MMRFRGSSRGYNRRRPGDRRTINRIDLPDFIPFERNDNSQHMSSPFQHNRKGGNSEDRYLSRRESSASMERQKRKHSPITHHQSSSQPPKKYRSKSPVNLKVTARVKNTSLNGSFSADYDNNNFPRLYDDSRPKRSPIIFDLDDPRSKQHSMNEPKRHTLPQASNYQAFEGHENSMRGKKSPSDDGRNDELDIAERLEMLERDKKQLVVHCNGLRDTLDQYYREISKLESLIYTWSEEIDILKRRVYK